MILEVISLWILEGNNSEKTNHLNRIREATNIPSFTFHRFSDFNEYPHGAKQEIIWVRLQNFKGHRQFFQKKKLIKGKTVIQKG